MMTPHRAIYHSPTPKHAVLILAGTASASLVLSGLVGIASFIVGRLL